MGSELHDNEKFGWKQIAIEASCALALLDAERLEDLARSCRALNRDLPRAIEINRTAVLREARQATGALTTFAQVLDATRANLQVFYQLRELQTDSAEYSPSQPRPWAAQECPHGYH